MSEARDTGIADLATQIRQRRVIAFVGAGVSVQAGYPTWNMLLDRFHDVLLAVPRVAESPTYIPQLSRMPDQLWRADEYRRLLGDAGFNAVLWDTFKPRSGQLPQVLSLLAQIPFRHYLTTNYDATLEMAVRAQRPKLVQIDWHDNDGLSRFLACLSQADGQPHLVYLHGRYDDPPRIVLTESDYVRRYVLNDDAGRKLFAVFITQPVLFVGFSLNDPELTYIMRNVNARVGGGVLQHFAILPSPGKRDEETAWGAYYRKRYGVTAIFYDTKNSHAELAAILMQLRTAADSPAVAPEGRDAALAAVPVRERAVRARRSTTRKVEYDPDDPNKGRFGGLARRGGWSLEATIAKTDEPDWFAILLVVRTRRPLRRDRKVKFHLHPTFTPRIVTVTARKGEARLERWAYGAFTVGVEILGEKTRLELDLSELENAPAAFRRR